MKIRIDISQSDVDAVRTASDAVCSLERELTIKAYQAGKRPPETVSTKGDDGIIHLLSYRSLTRRLRRLASMMEKELKG